MAKVVLLRGKDVDHFNISTEAIIKEAKTIADEDLTTEVIDNGILLTCQSEEGMAALLAKGSLSVLDQELVISKPPQSSPKSGVKLHIKNLDEGITTEALTALFQPHGTVKHAEVKTNKEGKSKCFGQVIMSTQVEADKAIAELNDTKQGESSMTVILAPEPEKGKGKDKAKGEKGAGKGNKGDKGKGKGRGGKNQQANAQPDWAAGWSYPSASPQMPQMSPWMGAMNPYAAMNPYGMPGMNPYGSDPVYAQIMHQQMLTMHLYSQMAAQPQATNDPGTGKGKGKGKGKPKDKGTKVDGTFTGKLKSINFREDKGFGFIDCAETKAIYGRDVYVSTDLVPKEAKVGDQFEFNAVVDSKGQLRANKVVNKA